MKLTKSLIFFTIIMFQLCSNSVIKRETNKNRTVEELRQKIISYLENNPDTEKLNALFAFEWFSKTTTETTKRIRSSTMVIITTTKISNITTHTCPLARVFINRTSKKQLFNTTMFTRIELTNQYITNATRVELAQQNITNATRVESVQQNITNATTNSGSFRNTVKPSYLQEIALIIFFSLFFIEILIIVLIIIFRN